MRIARFLPIVVLALAFVGAGGTACHPSAPVGPAIGSAATCELSVLETQAKDVGSDITIGEAIFSAIASGGATLPALFAAIETDLGAGTARCASQLADALETAFESTGSGSDGGCFPSALELRKAGHVALRALMKLKGW